MPDYLHTSANTAGDTLSTFLKALGSGGGAAPAPPGIGPGMSRKAQGDILSRMAATFAPKPKPKESPLTKLITDTQPQGGKPSDGGPPLGPSATPVPGEGDFSPYDPVFKKWAGELANDPQFISLLAAASLQESGWQPNRSWADPSDAFPNGTAGGLFAIHSVHQQALAGMGYNLEDRRDPDVATQFMMPRFVKSYNEARSKGLEGEELVSETLRMAERPAGYSDPNSPAAMAYKRAWRQVLALRGRSAELN